MAIAKIISAGGLPTILLPPELFAESGLHVGDNVEVAVNGRAIEITGKGNRTQQSQFEAIAGDVLDRNAELYRRLAEG